MKMIRIALAGLLVLVAAIAVFIYLMLRLSLSPTQGEFGIEGLEHPVEIRFDAYQRPFVNAQNLTDALAAQGYLHASHRLWQMETLRRAGKGRLAQLLGKDALATDMELWRLGIPGVAESLQENASPRLAAGVRAYVEGVNSAIKQYRVLPPEFLLLQHAVEPWTEQDVYAVGAMTAYQSAKNLKNELLRLALLDSLEPEQFTAFVDDNSDGGDYPFLWRGSDATGSASTVKSTGHDPVVAAGALSVLNRLAAADAQFNPHMPSLALGSNSWVIGPKKSATGKALYAFDSHDLLGLPNLFYELHLFFDDGRQLRGWSVPGLPGVINGFNERIAWGFTNIGDTQDLFLERICDDKGGYQDGDSCKPARTRIVEIPVRGRTEPETLKIVYSHNGPLVSEAPPIAVAWTAHHIGGRGLDALLDLNLARNFAEISAALDQWAAPSLNITWADVDGNIGFRSAGLLPVRGAGQGLFPLRGDRPDYRWRGFVAAADMPLTLNPEVGYLAAANARVNPATSYPLVAADNARPYRIQRLQDVLSRDQRFTVENMRALQMDWHDGQAQQLLPQLLPFLEGQQLTPPASRALELLRAWQAEPLSAPDSAAALIFQAWYPQIARSVFESSLGTELFQQLLKHAYPLNNALDTLILSSRHEQAWPELRAEFRGAVLAEALEHTVAELQAALGSGPDEWRLDQLQRVYLEHQLGKAQPDLAALFSHEPQPWGGSTATLGRARYSYQALFRVSTGATVRAVAEMDGVPRMASVIPGGQSGHPLSPHYTDQFGAWLAGQLLPIAELAPAGNSTTLTLLPHLDSSPDE